MTRDKILLLVLRACAEEGLIPRGYSTHRTAVEHAAELLARALDAQSPEPPPALPPGRPDLKVMNTPTQVLPRYQYGRGQPPRFQQGVAQFPARGRR